MYQALYRKYRPQTFSDVVGQKGVTDTLRAQLETGNLFQRAKALVPILIPLFVSSFRRADELAIAMECRCYRGGAGRTRLKEYHMSGRDYWALCVTLINLGLIILANLYLPWLAL